MLHGVLGAEEAIKYQGGDSVFPLYIFVDFPEAGDILRSQRINGSIAEQSAP